MTDKIVVLSTCSSAEESAKIAHHLLALRLVACAAITPAVRSVYHWQGAIEESAEWALSMKTRRDLFAELCTELRKLHSYEVPEIVAVPIVDGSAGYLEWMDRELRPLLPYAGAL